MDIPVAAQTGLAGGSAAWSMTQQRRPSRSRFLPSPTRYFPIKQGFSVAGNRLSHDGKPDSAMWGDGEPVSTGTLHGEREKPETQRRLHLAHAGTLHHRPRPWSLALEKTLLTHGYAFPATSETPPRWPRIAPETRVVRIARG
jgi:hypothetical protein